MGWKQKIKRVVDVVGAGVGLVALSPVMAATAAAVGWSMGRPILFRQTRPGLGGEPFVLVKFRTMRQPNEGQEAIGNDEGRITAVGSFLRSTSLDELPTLWNVLRGELSLVGPRPLLMRYLDRYSPEQARRHEVRPGITGWAQINGRNALNWDEKLALDVWYVDHHNLWVDIKILALTVVKVVFREGISSDDHVTMPEFWGPSDKRSEPRAS